MARRKEQVEAQVGLTVEVKIAGIKNPQPVLIKSESNGKHAGFWAWCPHKKVEHFVFVPAGTYPLAPEVSRGR